MSAEGGDHHPSQGQRGGPFSYPAFVRLWLADAASWLGTFSFTLALQLLMISHLGASQADIGAVRAAQWVPALAFGLLSGVWVERMRRRPVLIGADLVAAAALGAIVALAWSEVLTIWMLALLVFVVGTASIIFTAAHQSLVPRLVPVRLLPAAHARLEQAMTAAEATGPLLAGVLVRAVGAPVAIAVNAVTHLVSAALIASMRVTEPAPPSRADRSRLLADLREGAAWVYRHRTLRPYALGLHLWFFFNSAVMTVFVFYAVVDLGLSAVQIGAVLAGAGVSGVIGAGLAPRMGRRWGTGAVYVASTWVSPLVFALVLAAGALGPTLPTLVLAHLLYGLAMGIEGPLSLSYRNAVTPDRLRARMNATIRSVNWGSIAISAPLAGWAATMVGNRTVIFAGVLGLVLAALVVTLSPYRGATLPEDDASAPGPE